MLDICTAFVPAQNEKRSHVSDILAVDNLNVILMNMVIRIDEV